MAEHENPKTHPTSNAVKDPHDWTTGDEPMTGAQASYLKTLSEEAHEEFPDDLNKADPPPPSRHPTPRDAAAPASLGLAED